MKKTRIRSGFAAIMCLFFCACATQQEPFSIQVPKTIIAVTDAQKRLLSDVKSLSQGMTISDVKNVLGKPEEEFAHSLFYTLIEDKIYGGYFITVRLIFDDHGLIDAEVIGGHITLSPKF